MWALDGLYRWVDDGEPMPRRGRASPETRTRPTASRATSTALGGLRTPWVDVPDARYVAPISPEHPPAPGMKPFTDEQMQALYGSRGEYEQRVRARLDQMVDDGFLLARDRELVFP